VATGAPAMRIKHRHVVALLDWGAADDGRCPAVAASDVYNAVKVCGPCGARRGQPACK
jgi:hypothetical protein